MTPSKYVYGTSFLFFPIDIYPIKIVMGYFCMMLTTSPMFSTGLGVVMSYFFCYKRLILRVFVKKMIPPFVDISILDLKQQPRQ